MTGQEFMQALGTTKDDAREAMILKAILTDDQCPPFLDEYVSVQVTGLGHTLVYRVAPDYLAIGTNDDYVLMPMYPTTAQKIADAWNCILPTYRMVNQIYGSSKIKLGAHPFDPAKNDNTANATYAAVNAKIAADRLVALKAGGWSPTPGPLAAGHKKDVIISRLIATHPNSVFIYGWFQAGNPIQGLPLFTGHSHHYVDYSHGIRMVDASAMLDGVAVDLRAVLANPSLCGLVSGEGPITSPRYVV
jgi:hypothetical protein